MSTEILCSVENGIQKIVLNRPKRKNAITWLMYARLSEILEEASRNNNVYMVVLTGNGQFFSSGNDMNVTATPSNDSIDPVSTFKKFVDVLITYPKLLIAIVNGPAVGIAVTMLPLFDMVYASNMAYFQTPFTKLGLVAEGCSTYTFPRIMGNSKAGDMLYLGYKMNATEAKEFGLISEIYDHDSLEEVWNYLRKVSELSMESVLAIKRLVKKWNEKVLLEVNQEEAYELSKRIESPDFIERVINFMSRKSKL